MRRLGDWSATRLNTETPDRCSGRASCCCWADLLQRLVGQSASRGVAVDIAVASNKP
jgi:hypothetical protein